MGKRRKKKQDRNGEGEGGKGNRIIEWIDRRGGEGRILPLLGSGLTKWIKDKTERKERISPNGI